MAIFRAKVKWKLSVGLPIADYVKQFVCRAKHRFEVLDPSDRKMSPVTICLAVCFLIK